MKKGIAGAIVSALLYAQGLLGFAGVAALLLKDRANAAEPAAVVAPR